MDDHECVGRERLGTYRWEFASGPPLGLLAQRRMLVLPHEQRYIEVRAYTEQTWTILEHSFHYMICPYL